MNVHKAAERGVPSLVWGAGQQRRLDLAVKQIGLSPERRRARALVNGCGTGLYLEKLAPYFREVVGFDIEPAYLEAALQDGRGPLARAACEMLPLPDESCDVVFSHEVLEHVIDDRKSMEEMSRVLRPGGFILLFLPNRWFPFETHGCFLDGQYLYGNIPLLNYLPLSWRHRFAPHVRTYDVPKLRKLLDSLPLRVIHWSCLWPGFDALEGRLPTMASALKAARTLAEDTPLRNIGISHFLVLEAT